MDLGEKLRTFRQQRNFTQPELAAAMGIEQSYLSKLENGKSIPSSDVFGRILEVFQIGVDDLVDDLDQAVRGQLRQIPVVAQHFDEQKRVILGSRRRWLLISAALLATGAALIYAGAVDLFVPNSAWYYISEGIVREGEPREIFLERGPDAPDLAGRRLEDYLVVRSYRGDTFNVPVDGGSRTYHLDQRRTDDPWQNKAIGTLGVLLLVFGATGLVLEKKLSRFQ